MHSYYKKILQEKKASKYAQNSFDFGTLQEKRGKIEIPEIHLPIASLYRSRGFNHAYGTPQNLNSEHPTHKMFKYSTRTCQLQKNDSKLQESIFITTNVQASDQFVGPTKIPLKNLIQTVSNKKRLTNIPSLKLPELLLNVTTVTQPNDDQFDQLHTKKTNSSPLEKQGKDTNTNPPCFKRTKRIYAEKFESISPTRIKDINQKLEGNRFRRAANYKKKALIDSIEKSQDRSRNKDGRYEEGLSLMNDRLLSGGDYYGDDGYNIEALASRNQPSSKGNFVELLEEKKNTFDENSLLQVLESDFKEQEKKMDHLRNGKKRTMTLGDKYYFLETLNEKHIHSLLEEQKKNLYFY
jgi:hypothetical protein